MSFAGAGVSAVDGEFWGLDNVSVQLTSLPAQGFTLELDDVIGVGNPGPGAGTIELPRAEDQYVFEVEAPDTGVFSTPPDASQDSTSSSSTPTGPSSGRVAAATSNKPSTPASTPSASPTPAEQPAPTPPRCTSFPPMWPMWCRLVVIR